MAKLFIVIAIVLAVAFFFLAVGVIFRKDGKFRSEDVGANREMQKRGIHCARTQDRVARGKRGTIKDMMQ